MAGTPGPLGLPGRGPRGALTGESPSPWPESCTIMSTGWSMANLYTAKDIKTSQCCFLHHHDLLTLKAVKLWSTGVH
jgi:hypothetical protein